MASDSHRCMDGESKSNAQFDFDSPSTDVHGSGRPACRVGTGRVDFCRLRQVGWKILEIYFWSAFSKKIALVFIIKDVLLFYFVVSYRPMHTSHVCHVYKIFHILILEIRSVERGICPIATSTMNELFI